jgi:hypothetical protein
MKRFLIAAAALLCAAATGSAQDIPLSKILVEGNGWKVAAKDVPKVTQLSGLPSGAVNIFTESLYAHIDATGKFEKEPPGNEPGEKWVPSVFQRSGAAKYWIDTESRSVVQSTPKMKETLKLPNGTASCLTIWHGDEFLVVGCSDSRWLWAVQLQPDGSFRLADRYYSLRVKPGEKTTKVTAMVMDAGNLLYAATPLGVQVFDPTGRLCGVILPPSKDEMTAITIGGEKGDTLFVAAGDKIYSRKIQGKAVYTLKKDK